MTSSWRSNSAGGMSISPSAPTTRWYSRTTTSPGRRPVTMPPGRTAALTALRANELTGIGPPDGMAGCGRGTPGPAAANPRDGQEDQEERQQLAAFAGEDPEVANAGK